MPYIIKADGSKELFNQQKLESSLARAQASPDIVAQIIDHLQTEIKAGTTTADLYKHAFFLLHKMEKRAAVKYSLRRALSDLGPTGFPFEKYVARIFQERGFTTLTGQQVKGGCVEHEVDVVAWNDEKLIMTEAKFHNELGIKSDLKIALYVKARFDDLREATYFYGKRRKLDEGWLVTNTKFTSTAIEYGMCKGLTMIGWNFPARGNLQQLIEDGNLHPVTCLSSLTRSQAAQLVSHGVVLCKELIGHNELLRNIGLTPDAVDAVTEEISQLL